MNESYARKQLVKFCSLLYDRELTVSAGGNMSIRLNEKEIVITPSGKNKGLLDEEELLIVSMDGEVLTEGKPSIETGMHLALYKKNQNTGAIVHCHPLNCVALTLKKKIRTDLTPEGVILLGDVPTVGYYTPGTWQMQLHPVPTVMPFLWRDTVLSLREGLSRMHTTVWKNLNSKPNCRCLLEDAEASPRTKLKDSRGCEHVPCDKMVRNLPL